MASSVGGWAVLLLLGLAGWAWSAAPPVPWPLEEPDSAKGENYAVLVAGSNSWFNYRHQADVCHAYQVLVEHGFKKENIITFMYGDIANSSENPTPGVIINKPDGPNVYSGVEIDYRGSDVNPTNFLNVIKGNATAMEGVGSGRVLQSTRQDRVFINFVDHGGPSVICFPEELLSATDLNAALQYMHDQGMYKQLLFYLEACESGSMFQDVLPDDIAIYATTASNAELSSYACYFDSERQTYLGDVYSVKWMEDSDVDDLTKETLEEQYLLVKNETTTSPVCQFGQMSVSEQPVANFFGKEQVSSVSQAVPIVDAIESRDVDVQILLHRSKVNPTDASVKLQLAQMLQRRERVRYTFQRIVEVASGEAHPEIYMSQKMAVNSRNRACVESSVLRFHRQCFNLAVEYHGLEHAMSFVSMCESGVPEAAIHRAIDQVCPLNGAASLLTQQS
ncbi:Legumain [Balamuthia mandrillaris]